MKIIISENQELDVKKKFIFMLLNNKNYNLVEIDNDRIYFANKIGDDYAEIRYDKSNGWCGISYNLITFLSKITGFGEFEVKKLIVKWVEHTLQMKVKDNPEVQNKHTLMLNIPYKWR